jgi:DNA-binding response OmpR family regulator
MRILLVEDEPRAAQMLANGLREQALRRDWRTISLADRRASLPLGLS